MEGVGEFYQKHVQFCFQNESLSGTGIAAGGSISGLPLFNSMVRGWFNEAKTDYNDFIKAMLQDDVDAMNEYMNRVTLKTFSYFDAGNQPSGEEPE